MNCQNDYYVRIDDRFNVLMVNTSRGEEGDLVEYHGTPVLTTKKISKTEEVFGYYLAAKDHSIYVETPKKFDNVAIFTFPVSLDGKPAEDCKFTPLRTGPFVPPPLVPSKSAK